MIDLKIKRLHESAIIPAYATDGAACFDLHVAMPHWPGFSLMPRESAIFDTQLAFEVPPGWVMKVYSRSGHGFKYSVRLGNGTGVIDSDFRGQVMIALRNDGDEPLPIKHGDRIAQAMLERVERVSFIEVDELSDTARGAGGMGSTGT